ncbi:ret finger protein-like 4A [Mastomys coucha]|uniref:ret finger protein-like 4A n=1 Tax=Mastomys coucha TaxID=35658 RepID=UPI001261FC5F|nr:ret finger protein-like 4A [Mastomys coucha]XP_031241102.1 ret finger protein-like 4A [Mastomys coucha]
MAHLFKEKSNCYFCFRCLESPVYLNCGYICCLQCLDSLEKSPEGDGVLCPTCSVVSLKEEIIHAKQLGHLVTKIKDLQPQLNLILRMNLGLKIFQVRMTMDVDTAQNHLLISDDLLSVYYTSQKQDRTECAERFHPSPCVLGSSRFTSGRHYWEVVVGTSKEWDIGICKESIDRKKTIYLSDKSGFWTVGVREKKVYAACTEPLTELLVNPRLHRVGIFLDLLEKSVSFWDLGDGSHIYTFLEIPDTDPFRPFFSPATSYPDDQEQVLSICPVTNPGIFRRPVNHQ